MTTRARRGVKVTEWEPMFLEALSLHGIVVQAVKQSGVTRSTVYLRREKTPAFATKWDEALDEALSNIELAVTNAALEGDMQTARWLLSRRMPEKYGDKLSLEHSGKDGGPIQTDMKVILDALADPKTRDALDALSRRLESQPSGDGS